MRMLASSGAAQDLNLRPLGYEHCDARLCRLGQSPVTAFASAHSRREVSTGLPRLPRSRSVPPRLVYGFVYKIRSPIWASCSCQAHSRALPARLIIPR
jgi:hypothetical protein